MKKMKKLASLVLALAMALTLAVPALAANADLTGHEYKAYQIFSGTQAEDSHKLGNVVWGNGIDGESFLTALKADEDGAFADAFDACTTPAQVAEAMDNWSDSDPKALAFAELAYEHKNTNGIACTNGVTTLNAGYYLIVDETEFEDGATDTVYNLALLQLTKKGIFEIVSKVGLPQIDKTVNTTTANIGEKVTFTLTATMPSTVEGYDTYKVIFHDTLSDGLAFVENTVKVTVDGEDKTASFTSNHDNGTLTITCQDVLAQDVGAEENSKIVVTYDAIVDEDAVIGLEGNPNKVYLEYSNNPNVDGTGKTTEKEVKVFTWEIPVFKYTGTDTPLAGAGFTLYTDDKCTTAVNLVAGENNVYKVCALANCTGEHHVNKNEIVTDTTGKFEIEGLAEGTYYLKETTTPDGYNTCDVITVVIAAEGKLTQDGDATTEVGVLNNSGSELPETGGMGTTLFYALGAVLVIGAGVAMVTKKRMA